MEYYHPNGSTGITEVIHWASKLGRQVAEFENDDDQVHAKKMRKAFEARLTEMPKNALGGFYIFGDAAIVAYTEGYIRNIK